MNYFNSYDSIKKKYEITKIVFIYLTNVNRREYFKIQKQSVSSNFNSRRIRIFTVINSNFKIYVIHFILRKKHHIKFQQIQQSWHWSAVVDTYVRTSPYSDRFANTPILLPSNRSFLISWNDLLCVKNNNIIEKRKKNVIETYAKHEFWGPWLYWYIVK